MPDTFSQIYIQLVFAVKGRGNFIHSSWEIELHKYMSGFIQNNGQKLLAINGIPDHIHIFIGMKPSCCLSDFIRELKKASSTFIKDKKLSPYAFQWQEGYGAFSYSHSNLNQVIAYIMNQKEHHKKKTFKEEYLELIQKFEIEYNPRNLFDWIDF